MEFGSEILEAVECEGNDPGPCNTIKFINLELKKWILYINENENMINKEIILFYMWFELSQSYWKDISVGYFKSAFEEKNKKVEQSFVIERYE